MKFGGGADKAISTLKILKIIGNYGMPKLLLPGISVYIKLLNNEKPMWTWQLWYTTKCEVRYPCLVKFGVGAKSNINFTNCQKILELRYSKTTFTGHKCVCKVIEQWKPFVNMPAWYRIKYEVRYACLVKCGGGATDNINFKNSQKIW